MMPYLLRRSLEIYRRHGLRRLLAAAISYPLRVLFSFYYSFRNLRRLTANYTDEHLNDFLFRGCHGLLQPFQHDIELLSLIRFVREMRPANVLEIGTACGATLFVFCSFATASAKIVSIDLPEGKFGGGYPLWRIPFFHSFAAANQQLHLIRGDSHGGPMLQKIKGIMGEDGIDLLYIDGDHTYEGVKQDFLTYGPLVRKGGAVVFHDIAEAQAEACYGVHRFWEEIKNGYRHTEFMAGPKQAGGGIGICFIE